MNKTVQKFILAVLGRQVRALRRKHEFKVVGVVDSTATLTGTTLARVLNETVHVRHAPSGSNEHDVLLQFFGIKAPKLFNLFAWIGVFIHNRKQMKGGYPYKIVVLECPEGIMGLQQYTDFDAVLMVSEKTLQVPGGRIKYDVNAGEVDFHLANMFAIPSGFEADIKHAGEIYLHVSLKASSEAGLLVPLSVIVTARELGFKTPQIQTGLAALWRPQKETTE